MHIRSYLQTAFSPLSYSNTRSYHLLAPLLLLVTSISCYGAASDEQKLLPLSDLVHIITRTGEPQLPCRVALSSRKDPHHNLVFIADQRLEGLPADIAQRIVDETRADTYLRLFRQSLKKYFTPSPRIAVLIKVHNADTLAITCHRNGEDKIYIYPSLVLAERIGYKGLETDHRYLQSTVTKYAQRKNDPEAQKIVQNIRHLYLLTFKIKMGCELNMAGIMKVLRS